MSALYERSQLTQVMISSAPATAETMEKAEYLRLDCTIKEVQFTAGQKQDIDVTTLCSTAVSYTHSTLPTIHLALVQVAPGSLKKQKSTRRGIQTT
ncbi:hypothetical protein UQ34_26180, partial [Escherichia coli]